MLCSFRRLKVTMGAFLFIFVTCHHFPSIPTETRYWDPFSSTSASTYNLTAKYSFESEENTEDLSTLENSSYEHIRSDEVRSESSASISETITEATKSPSKPADTIATSSFPADKTTGSSRRPPLITYKTTRRNTPNYDNERKYLLYMAQSGWSNQKKCLMNVYYIARQLNRTLILPPVLPHKGAGATIALDIMTANWTDFRLGTRVQDFYLRRLPSKMYLPMKEVLDIPFSFKDVPTIDVRDFYSDEKNGKATKWVVESKYSHFNTIWMHNSPDLEGSTTLLQRFEYGRERSFNQTYRDVTLLNRVSAEVLVVLDTFKMVLDNSMMTPSWQSRLSLPIRQTARAIIEKWDVPAYAAVHIRGGDGFFQGEEKVRDTIHNNMFRIANETLFWLKRQQDFHETTFEEVGLFVGTDLPKLSSNIAMKNAIEHFRSRLSPMNITLRTFLSGANKVMASEIHERLPDLSYKELLVDMQLAICADIAFVGTSLSSFSGEIKRQRLNQISNCAISATAAT